MRFSSGICGVVVILFALMGSIGIGYLLNGENSPESVNDYTYVTDVSGLYDFTPVAQYSDYSPAQNNYQYSTSLTDLGRYTSGINYTAAGSANLNPIKTPASGTQVVTKTVQISSLGSNLGAKILVAGPSLPYYVANDPESVRYISLSDLLTQMGVGPYQKAVVSMPVQTMTATVEKRLPGPTEQVTVTQSYQPFTLAMQDVNVKDTVNDAINNQVCVAFQATTASIFNTDRVGYVSDLTVEANGAVTYVYNFGGNSQVVTKNINEVNCIIWQGSQWSNNLTQISAEVTEYTNVEYLDANQGVSLSGNSVYWSNGNDIGAASWMFSKPSAPMSFTFKGYTSGGLLNSWTVSYDLQWVLTYTDQNGTVTNLRLGSSWSAIQITDWYTGQIQVTPVKTFTNFTAYDLGTAKTYTQLHSSNMPLTYFEITKNSGTVKFACTGTQVRTGGIPGAMYDATFTLANYFPDLESARISFDSAAFVGTSVAIGDWTMVVDSSSFRGTFTHEGRERIVDLTKPWSVSWLPGGGVEVTFTEVGRAVASSVQIADDAEKIVRLNGQWVVDTDLYEIGTHLEEKYDWNFGNWGLDASTFIVTVMGLTAIISIGFKLAKVPMGALDFVVIFMGNVICWVML